MAVFLSVHLPLGIAMYNNGPLGELHAVLTCVLAALLAMFGTRSAHVAYAAAYIAGSEVLWRMTQASFVWELGKYATAGTLLVALVRLRHARIVGLPLVYFLLLVPAAVMTFQTDPERAVRDVSFNLSGPFAVSVCVIFLSHTKLDAADVRRACIALMGPAASIAAITLYAVITSERLEFTSQSNFIVTGGFGPNQVSLALGLGALAAFMALVLSAGRRGAQLVLSAFLALFFIQAVLTFSRGGVLGALLAMFAGSVFLVSERRLRGVLFGAGVGLSAAAWLFVLPWLERMTDGMVYVRYTDPSLSGREELAQADWMAFQAHPIWGVGVGQSVKYRFVGSDSAHTEFLRMLSEHGTFGGCALLALLAMAGWCVWRARTRIARALAVALVTWSLLFMTNAAMRVVAPAFALGLAAGVAANSGPVRPRRRTGARGASWFRIEPHGA